MRSHRRLLALPALLAVLGACSDVAPTEPTPSPPGEITLLRCVANVREGTVACADPALPRGARGLLVGGQNQYVSLAANTPSYNTISGDFTFSATLQNLIPQPMGTTDGTTPAADGVRVFFHQAPAATVGAGAITVQSDGQATYTGANQHYYQYSGAELGADGILSSNETSSGVTWTFNMPATVLQFDFLVAVAADVPFPTGYIELTPDDDTLAAGSQQQLGATARSAVGNTLLDAITFGTSNAAVATVDASGEVTAVGPGTATITATGENGRTGQATIAVCPNLALGGVYVADMPAGSSFCLAGGAEYTVVPVNLSAAASVSLSFTGAGIVPISGPPSPRLMPGPRFSAARGAARLPRDDAWESRLRRLERRELAGRRADWGPRFQRGGAQAAITPGVPAVGALMNLNVETANACSTNDIRVGRVMAVGTTVIVMADTMNPAGLSAVQYAAIADSFDTVIHPVVTGAFGAPSDIDGNGRVIAFYTRAVNELTPPASSSFVGGFAFSRDLFPAASCPTSNVGEMFYMLAADPAGDVNGNVRSVSFILDNTLGTLGHEFEHLINSSRRMHVNTPWNGDFEDAWLDEGLAHVAEELLFYDAAGVAPEANVDVGVAAANEDAFFKYAESNFGRLHEWLDAPHASGGFQDDDDLATRGAAWAFLRYAADRQAGAQNAFWFGLVNTGLTGIANVQAELGTDPLPWWRDFAAAMYADDAVVGVPALYTQPSWDFRDLYGALDYNPGPGCSCAYPLAPRDPANGVADNVTLVEGGSAAYHRVGVAGGGFAGVTLLSGGVAPPATVRVAVFRRE